jgi:hypothetical protein
MDRGFGNRLPWKIFGPEGEEITRWRKLHSEEFYNVHSSPVRRAN